MLCLAADPLEELSEDMQSRHCGDHPAFGFACHGQGYPRVQRSNANGEHGDWNRKATFCPNRGLNTAGTQDALVSLLQALHVPNVKRSLLRASSHDRFMF